MQRKKYFNILDNLIKNQFKKTIFATLKAKMGD